MNGGSFEHDGFDNDDEPFGRDDVAQDLERQWHTRNGKYKAR